MIQFWQMEERALSQGQRQLLSIARVFVKIPKILILDEAISSIDTRTEILVQRAFAKLMEDGPVLLLLIAYQPFNQLT